MTISRRHLLRRMGAAAAVAAAAPLPLSARGPATVRGPAPIRLSRNESPYGPSPDVLELIRQADTGALSLYPDLECETLRRKIAAAYDQSSDCVALGTGSLDLLLSITGTFAGRDSAIVAADPVCPAIERCARRTGAPLVRVPLAHDWSHDLAAMLRRCDRTTGLVYICNPHNPTASLTGRAALEAFMRALPATTHVVIDEAYHEYVKPAADYASFLDRPVADRRVIVLRTFSKAYGLAGLRVGYAVADPAVAARIEDRDAVPAIATAAALAASAAIEDRAHVRSVVARVTDDRQEFYNQANARMLRVIDSHANFVMLNTARRASDIVGHFGRNGIALPAPFTPLDEYLRVSLGTASDMAEFWRVWDLMSLGHTL